MFRYRISYWSELDNKEMRERGFIVGESYTEAVKNLTSVFTDRQGNCSITEIYLYEIDTYGCGLLSDDSIEETWEAERPNVKPE